MSVVQRSALMHRVPVALGGLGTNLGTNPAESRPIETAFPRPG